LNTQKRVKTPRGGVDVKRNKKVTVQTAPPAKKLRLYAILRDMRAPKRNLSAFCVHYCNGSVTCPNCNTKSIPGSLSYKLAVDISKMVC